MSLAQSLEGAAAAVPALADAIRPANGDPERVLAAAGIAGGRQILAWLFDHDSAAGAELARAWSESAAGAQVVLELGEETLSKPGRKALRRVLHALRARGIRVPEPGARPLVSSLPRIADELGGAFLSALDRDGARLAVLVEAQPGGGARIFDLILDEARGVLEAAAFDVKRGQARRFVKNMTARRRDGAFPIALPAFQAVVRRCAETHPADRALPRVFLEWRSKLAGAPADEPTPGALARLALGDDITPARLARAAELATAQEIGPWPPAVVTPLREAAERIGDAVKSKLVVSGVQRREQIDALLREAARQAYGGTNAPRTATQLEESAWALWQQGRDDDARACLAAARALREAPDGELAVARALLEVALAPVLRAAQEAEDQALVVPS